MKNRTKRWLSLILAACMMLGLAGCGTTVDETTAGQTEQQTTAAPVVETTEEASLFVAGTYTGEAQGRNGMIKVEVEVSDEAILSVKVTEHIESPMISDNALTKIPEQIVANQSLDVDMISGATLSSVGVRMAVDNALTQGGMDTSAMYVSVDKKVEVAEPVEADICIVGAGVAGLTAAVRALELGENVVVFEQSGVLGGSCAVASGQIMGAGTKMQAAANIEDSADVFYDNIIQLLNGAELPYPELTRAFVDKSGEMIDWLDEYVGASFGTRVPGLGLYIPPNRERIFWTQGGYNIVGPLAAKLQEGIDAGKATLYMDTEVTGFLQEADGTVTGVVVTDSNGETREYSFKAAILACGGYCHNEELLKKYHYTNIGSGAPNMSMGSNIYLAEKVGAQLALMTDVATYPAAIPNQGFDIRYQANTAYPGSILVTNAGTRFANEESVLVVRGAYNKVPANEIFVVFTEAMRDEAKNIINITGYNEAALTSQESWALLDQLAEADNCVYKADTVEELAAKMGVDAAALANTISTYNGYAENGTDEAFGRQNMTALAEGPYYAIYTIPYVIQTAGGILTDTTAAVQNNNNETIVGLYACGEAVGMNLVCRPSHGGKSIGNGTIFGMIAAESAVAFVK
ncbi:MAG: FAD-dependent oxidoreductase [Lachnospiraceae bacterium]|nr:FAD-dependent oxidoreductase [Lachnospiraceae bacterium]